MRSGSGTSGTHRLDRNIDALLARRKEEERQSPVQDKVAQAVTRFAGSMSFVYLHIFIFGVWIFGNIGFIPLFPVFDPSLVILAMEASVEAIFISTFVMISQNRMAAADDKRADLNLQISLLVEHEVTKILTLVAGLAEKNGVSAATSEELEELQQDVAPEAVLDQSLCRSLIGSVRPSRDVPLAPRVCGNVASQRKDHATLSAPGSSVAHDRCHRRGTLQGHPRGRWLVVRRHCIYAGRGADRWLSDGSA